MCACQGVRNISFSENLAYALNEWPLKPRTSSFGKVVKDSKSKEKQEKIKTENNHSQKNIDILEM